MLLNGEVYVARLARRLLPNSFVPEHFGIAEPTAVLFRLEVRQLLHIRAIAIEQLWPPEAAPTSRL